MPNYRDPRCLYLWRLWSAPWYRELTRAISRSLALNRLIDDVRNYQPDIIYLRCGGYIFPLERLFSIVPVVMELNTNDIAQRSLGVRTLLVDVLTRGLVLSNVSGLVAVTHEIGTLPANADSGSPCV